MPTDLWRYAQALYRQPGVEAACLQLQAQGTDVCLLLCACWLEQRQLAANASQALALRELAQPWQTQVVLPLRQLRQEWRAHAQQDAALMQLREQLKQLELQAERQLLQRLESLCLSWPASAEEKPGHWLEQLSPASADRGALQLLRAAASQLQI